MTLREQLQAIYNEHGHLTPELVVQVARPRGHPLHSLVFDRTVKEASEAWYRHRAHELIRSARVVYREADETDGAHSVRAFHAVRATDNSYVYEPVEKIADDPLLRRIVLRDMEREWKALHRRYREFAEFAEIVRSDLDGQAVA